MDKKLILDFINNKEQAILAKKDFINDYFGITIGFNPTELINMAKLFLNNEDFYDAVELSGRLSYNLKYNWVLLANYDDDEAPFYRDEAKEIFDLILIAQGILHLTEYFACDPASKIYELEETEKLLKSGGYHVTD
jgi:hypothetical protein